MFLWWDLIFFTSNDLLSVVNQECREEQCNQARVNCMNDRVSFSKENASQDTKNEKNPTCSKQVHPHASEVNLGLERKQSQSQAQESCNSHGHKDPVDIMVDRNTGYPN